MEGESVRVISDTGQLPDGIDANTVYFVQTTDAGAGSPLNANNIKLAKTFLDALSATDASYD